MRMAPEKPRGSKGCKLCGGTGWSRTSSAACDCVRAAPAPVALQRRPAPMPEGTRACDGCGHPTRALRLCAACERARDEQLRTDEAFNARVRGGRAARRAAEREAAIARTSAPAPSSSRAPIAHRSSVAATLRPRPAVVTESRVVYDDDARQSVDRAWADLRGRDDESEAA